MKPGPVPPPGRCRLPVCLLLAFMTLSVLGMSGAAFAVHGGSDREVVEGDVVPKARKDTVHGEGLTLPAGEGLTVLVFWATWSPRSKQALELWEKFGKDYQDQPLAIVTVNAERDELTAAERADIDRYITDNIPSLDTVVDEGLELFNGYAVKALPTAFFVESTGKVLFRYPSFPTSAPLDLQEELEIALGIRERQTDVEKASRGKLDYQPKNNALLHYNMAVQLYKKGYRDKALSRMAMALEKDPDYSDPLRTLEGIFFAQGQTPEREAGLRKFLEEKGLGDQVDRIGQGEPIAIEGPAKIDAKERMRMLMEKSGASPGGS